MTDDLMERVGAAICEALKHHPPAAPEIARAAIAAMRENDEFRKRIEQIILVDVLDLKKPERAGAHCLGLASNAASKILATLEDTTGADIR